MKEFEEIDESLKEEIQSVCDFDPYGLSPKTLYRNIYHSSGSYETLAKIFEVSPQMIRAIKES